MGIDTLRTIMLENVSVDVVDGARVKGVLGVSVRPRWQGKGLRIDKNGTDIFEANSAALGKGM